MTLYLFEYFDLLRRRWVRARYRAEFGEIAERYPAFKIIGPGRTPSSVGGGTTDQVGDKTKQGGS